MKRLNLFHKKISIINEVERKNFLIRLIFFALASFLYGIIYNTFLVPNNIVIGGMSGLAIVIKELTGISNLSKLPTAGAIILIIISVLLTVIAGFIPAKIASKKDPVEALRTE